MNTGTDLGNPVAMRDGQTGGRQVDVDPGGAENQHISENTEEKDTAVVFSEGNAGLGWITGKASGHVFSSSSHPPVLAIGVSDKVEIGYDVDFIRMPKNWYKAKSMNQNSQKSSSDDHTIPEGGGEADEASQNSFSMIRPPQTGAGGLESTLRKYALDNPSRVMNLQSSTAERQSQEVQLLGGNMLYAKPQIVQPWYIGKVLKARQVVSGDNGGVRSTTLLALTSMKAQCQLWEVITYMVAAFIHCSVLIYLSFGDYEDAALVLLPKTDADLAISVHGAMSLPRRGPSGSYYWISVCIACFGALAMLLQIPEIMTCYIIASGMSTAIMFTWGLKSFEIFLPVLQSIMVYCVVQNRQRHMFSVVIADRTF
jgi:hypothetical protein